MTSPLSPFFCASTRMDDKMMTIHTTLAVTRRADVKQGTVMLVDEEFLQALDDWRQDENVINSNSVSSFIFEAKRYDFWKRRRQSAFVIWWLVNSETIAPLFRCCCFVKWRYAWLFMTLRKLVRLFVNCKKQKQFSSDYFLSSKVKISAFWCKPWMTRVHIRLLRHLLVASKTLLILFILQLKLL